MIILQETEQFVKHLIFLHLNFYFEFFLNVIVNDIRIMSAIQLTQRAQEV